MLVLTRKIGERIYIGDDIVVTVERIERGKVRLGINAPKSVKINRGELVDANPGIQLPRLPVEYGGEA